MTNISKKTMEYDLRLVVIPKQQEQLLPNQEDRLRGLMLPLPLELLLLLLLLLLWWW